MNEATHKRELVKGVIALGGYAVRVEDRFKVGILDLIIKYPGFPAFWAEGKMIDGFQFAPTLRQFEEGKKIQLAGGVALLLGWKNKLMYVSPWTEKADLRTCFYGGPSWENTLESYLKGTTPHG